MDPLPNPSKVRFGLLVLALCLPFSACRAADPSPTPTPTATPTPEAAPPAPSAPPPSTSKAILTIHKKMLSPSWGKVVQYRRYEKTAFAEKDRETLFEFVLQDNAGVVRVATYHESADDAGYWEVFVWDQP